MFTLYKQIHRASHWGAEAKITGHYLRNDGITTLCGIAISKNTGRLWTRKYASKYELDKYDCARCRRIANKQINQEVIA